MTKAEAVFAPPELKKTVQCICAKDVKLNGKLVAYTHTLGKENYGWFCVCRPDCFTARIQMGAC